MPYYQQGEHNMASIGGGIRGAATGRDPLKPRAELLTHSDKFCAFLAV